MKKLVAVPILLLLLFNLHDLKAQMVTYSGPVEYYMEVSKTAQGYGTDGGWNWNVSIDEKRILTGSFYVTFTGMAGGVGGLNMFKLTSIDENINYINIINNEGNDQRSMGKDMPDESRSRKYAVTTTRLSPEKPVIKSGFLMFQNGKYNMMLSGEMEVSVSSILTTEETYPQNRPPQSLSQTNKIKIPVAISGEKRSDNLKYLEGITILQNEQSDDCRLCMDGNMANQVHGDMECLYISKITTSWTLVKRNKECDATVTYLKGDVKINGMPAEKGTVKIGAGDVIETGEKSRIALSLHNGNEIYMLGSKSKLQLTHPCKPDTYNPPGKGQAVINFLGGKIFSQRCPGSYTRNDFESDEEWQRFQILHISWFRYGGAGVRGWNLKAPTIYFASTNSKICYCFLPPADPEKEELIPDFNSIPKEANAFYIHCENGEVKDFTVVKGTLKIEDTFQTKNKIVAKGTTTNTWDDGTIMSDVLILVK